MTMFGYHGVYDNEKKNGQNFEITVSCKLSIDNSYDSINKTVDYSAVMETISTVFNKKSYNLIESLADDMCSRILEEYNTLTKVSVSIKKPDAPIDYDFESVEVVCTKKR